jgi:hypothetical protein
MNNIAILGGGAAGWLTALFLKKLYPDTINVTVIEDPNKPPIIAGESGGISLSLFYRYLNIDIDEWIIKTNALPKLGGKFVDWNGVGTDFIHGSIDGSYDKNYSVNIPSFLGTNKDFVRCALAENIPIEEIFYNAKLISLNRLPMSLVSEGIDTLMWHFDSRANVEFLKNIGLSRDITLLEDTYTHAQKFENGNIKSLHFSSGNLLEADWFFDCSGFSRLLLKKEINVPFIDLANLFPASSVVAWWDKESKLVNRTNITAMKYGWSWNINLYNRAGNGYVYDSAHITVDQAIQEATARFNTHIDPIAAFTYTPSIATEAWRNNVIAIGLSSGFVEPLESNGLSQVIMQLELLERYWNPRSDTSVEKLLYNRYFTHLMNEIINFLLLHYKGHRRDTDFWKSHAYDSFRTTDTLKEKIEGWKNGAILDDVLNSNIYSFESYITVAQGLDLIDTSKLKNRLLSKRQDIFKDFYKSHDYLKLFLTHISNNSLSLEKWTQLTYCNTI